MPVLVKKKFLYDNFKPSQQPGQFSEEMFDQLMVHTKRIKPSVREIVKKYLVDGLSYSEIDPNRTKQSIYIRVRYYLQVGINAGFLKLSEDTKVVQ